MLVLGRRAQERILIGDDIEILVTRIEHDSVRLKISRPREIGVLRGELYRELKRLKNAETEDNQ
jgi:carbon storage regulator